MPGSDVDILIETLHRLRELHLDEEQRDRNNRDHGQVGATLEDEDLSDEERVLLQRILDDDDEFDLDDLRQQNYSLYHRVRCNCSNVPGVQSGWGKAIRLIRVKNRIHNIDLSEDELRDFLVHRKYAIADGQEFRPDATLDDPDDPFDTDGATWEKLQALAAQGFLGQLKAELGEAFPKAEAIRECRSEPMPRKPKIALQDIPSYDPDSGDWVTNKKAAQTENISVDTLTAYRTKSKDGVTADDRMSGFDRLGRVWQRKPGSTPSSDPYYYGPSLTKWPERPQDTVSKDT